MAQGNNQLQVNIVANVRAAQAAINKLAAKPVNLTINSKQFSQPLGRIQGQLGEFEKSLEASNARVIAFGASASAIYAVQKALSESVKSAIEVEKALTDINVILNLTDKSLAQFGASLFDIAKNTGNAFSTVATAATELSRQGLGVAETLKRTQDALILTRLSGLGAADSVEAITATLNGFQKAALSSTDVINNIVMYISLKELSILDTAYINHKNREKLINLYKNLNIEFSFDNSYSNPNNILKWISIKQINLIKLSLKRNNINYVTYNNYNGLLPPLTDDGLFEFVVNYNQLLSLDISWCNNITDNGVINLIKNCNKTN